MVEPSFGSDLRSTDGAAVPGAQTECRGEAGPVRFSLGSATAGDLLNVNGRGRKLLCGPLATN